MEYKEQTTSIQGSWPLDQWRWKHETAILMPKFLAALKDKKVLGLKCPGCGLIYSPPKPYCRCLSIPDEWVEIGDTGTITTFTFTGGWSFGGMVEGTGTPMILAGVKLDGADTQTLSILANAEPDQVAVGMRVRVKWPDNPKGVIDDAMHCELL
jgi:hypothetical protein